MIYCYGVETFIFVGLMRYASHDKVRNISNIDKLKKLVTNKDIILFFKFKNGDRKAQAYFKEQGIEMFPNAESSLFIADRDAQLRYIEDITKFNLKREYYVNYDKKYANKVVVPNLGTEKTVVKIGDYHMGQNKILRSPGSVMYETENMVFEPFIDNARSIRIIIFDNGKTIYIVEQVNPDNWIKNDCPTEELVYTYEDRHKTMINNIDAIIQDAQNIRRSIQADYVGVDYVVNDDVTGFLEINDMIGIPEDDKLREDVINYFKEVVNKYK